MFFCFVSLMVQSEQICFQSEMEVLFHCPDVDGRPVLSVWSQAANIVSAETVRHSPLIISDTMRNQLLFTNPKRS